MGTHPIFESDFDCLNRLESVKMSTNYLTWAITKKFSCYDLKRAGKNWTTEPGHLKGMKSLKYDTLSESKGLKVSANAEGGVNFSAGKANVTLKRNLAKPTSLSALLPAKETSARTRPAPPSRRPPLSWEPNRKPPRPTRNKFVCQTALF